MGRVGASGRLQRRPLSDPGPPRPLVHQAHQRRFVGLLVERRSEGSSTEAERDRASLEIQRLTVHRHIFTTESAAVKAAVKSAQKLYFYNMVSACSSSGSCSLRPMNCLVKLIAVPSQPRHHAQISRSALVTFSQKIRQTRKDTDYHC